MLIRSSLPKVLNGSMFCGKAADCWSVGATLFTMLAGFSPFETDEAEVRDSRNEGDRQVDRDETAMYMSNIAVRNRSRTWLDSSTAAVSSPSWLCTTSPLPGYPHQHAPCYEA